MAKAPGDKPASRGFLSSLGTFILAILLVGFGFWAGRTFETLWPSKPAAPAAPVPVAVATVSPSPAGSPEPSLSPSPAASTAPSPAAPAVSPSPAPQTTAGEVVAATPPRAARRGTNRRPSPGAPATGPEPAPEPVAALPPAPGRPFLYGAGLVESLKTTPTEVPGFDTSEVGVKRAPDVPGRVDFEVSPKTVKPGDRYAVKVFLVNDGAKDIAIDAFNVAMIADGKRSARAMMSKVRNVAPRSRALLAELPGVWQDGLATWALEVAITSKRQDRYTNTLNWK